MADRKIHLTIDIQNERFRRNAEWAKAGALFKAGEEIPLIVAQLEVVDAIDARIREMEAERDALPVIVHQSMTGYNYGIVGDFSGLQ